MLIQTKELKGARTFCASSWTCLPIRANTSWAIVSLETVLNILMRELTIGYIRAAGTIS